MATDTPSDRSTPRQWAASLLRRIADGIDDSPTGLPDREGARALRTKTEFAEPTTAASQDATNAPTKRVGAGAPPYYAEVVSCAQGCALVQNCNSDRTLPRRFLPRGTTSRA